MTFDGVKFIRAPDLPSVRISEGNHSARMARPEHGWLWLIDETTAHLSYSLNCVDANGTSPVGDFFNKLWRACR